MCSFKCFITHAHHSMMVTSNIVYLLIVRYIQLNFIGVIPGGVRGAMALMVHVVKVVNIAHTNLVYFDAGSSRWRLDVDMDKF